MESFCRNLEGNGELCVAFVKNELLQGSLIR